MAVSMREVDPVFQAAGQKDGLEIWRIEKLQAVPVPKESYGKFFTGDSYIILKITALKNGSFRHDIHYWLGKDTNQLVQLQSRLWNWMLLLVDALSNTVKCREMRPRNFFRTLNLVLYQRKVKLHLVSSMLKSMSGSM
uniref:Gelsolin-like domain-containing protein n=1 Tax=Arundo donax TaxID=35708 RepID=A0A0A9ALJ5_ARUDO